MKNKKKIMVVLLALLVTLLTAIPVSAYTALSLPATLDASVFVAPEYQMTLTDADSLPYTITYSFTVGNAEDATGHLANVTTAISGKPAISNIVFGPSTTFTAKVATAPMVVDWSGVTVKEPGLYRWFVTPAMDKGTAPENASNTYSSGMYLGILVEDVSGTLKVTKAVLAEDINLSAKPASIPQTYPAHEYDISITKTVVGAGDAYFQFNISITLPSGYDTTSAKSFTLSGHDLTVPATAYNAAVASQPTTLDIAAGATSGSQSIWLKGGQTLIVNDIPHASQYTVAEAGVSGGKTANGFDVSITVTGTDVDMTKTETAGTVTDTKLEGNVTIAVTNTKPSATLTGVELQTAAPVVGILVATSLFAILLIVKRRKKNEASC